MSMKPETVYKIIKSLTGKDNKLVIPRVFIDLCGDIPTALLLSQLIYWSERGDKKDKWVYKTYNELSEETSLKRTTLYKASKALKDKGLIATEVHKDQKGTPTVHYQIKERNIVEALSILLEGDIVEK